MHPQPRPPAELRAAVRATCEKRPGIYWMVGPGGEVLYVGKSREVRTRLLSYFRASPNEKAHEIIGNTHEIAWEYAPSEFAAVVAELRAIQRWQPPYNVEHRRDRAFCFVKLTREAAPRLLTVREVHADGAQYFGPFRGAEHVRLTVREISDLLELRDCAAATPMRFADQLDLFGGAHTPLCLRAQVRKCLAPCAGQCSRSTYEGQVELARRFLDGDAEPPLGILRARLQEAAARLNFEYAAAVRDRIARLEESAWELRSLRGVIDGLTFVYETGGRAYLIRRGRIREEREAPASPAEKAALHVHAARVLTRSEHQPGTVQPTQAAEILLLARWFRLHPEEREGCWVPDQAEARTASG
ncbi:MAG: nuclease [Gemmatimonadetes bacterium]|nr:nuclease [Gemmatimonadota bacterium]